MDDSSVRIILHKLTTYLTAATLLFSSCSGHPKTESKVIVDSQASSTGASDTTKAVVKEIPAFVYDSTKTYVYITLDDGPQKGTMNCYRILKEEGVKASFFMIGVHVDNNADREEVNEVRAGYPLFLLCNHSFTHANFNHYHSYYDHPDSALRDIEKNQHSLAISEKIVRTPGNSSWMVEGRMKAPKLTKPLCHLLDSAGYKAVGWDVEWRFRNGNIPVESAQRMVDVVNQYARSADLFKAKHVVILAHDRMFGEPQYADSLRKFIEILKANPKYLFETIDHYPGMQSKIN